MKELTEENISGRINQNYKGPEASSKEAGWLESSAGTWGMSGDDEMGDVTRALL